MLLAFNVAIALHVFFLFWCNFAPRSIYSLLAMLRHSEQCPQNMNSSFCHVADSGLHAIMW